MLILAAGADEKKPWPQNPVLGKASKRRQQRRSNRGGLMWIVVDVEKHFLKRFQWPECTIC